MINTYYTKMNAVKRHDQKVEFDEDLIRLDIPFPSSTGRITDNGAWRIMALGPPVVSFKLPQPARIHKCKFHFCGNVIGDNCENCTP